MRRHFSKIRVIDDGSYDKSFLSYLRDDGFENLRLPFTSGYWDSIQTRFRYDLRKGF